MQPRVTKALGLLNGTETSEINNANDFQTNFYKILWKDVRKTFPAPEIMRCKIQGEKSVT